MTPCWGDKEGSSPCPPGTMPSPFFFFFSENKATMIRPSYAQITPLLADIAAGSEVSQFNEKNMALVTYDSFLLQN